MQHGYAEPAADTSATCLSASVKNYTCTVSSSSSNLTFLEDIAIEDKLKNYLHVAINETKNEGFDDFIKKVEGVNLTAFTAEDALEALVEIDEMALRNLEISVDFIVEM